MKNGQNPRNRNRGRNNMNNNGRKIMGGNNPGYNYPRPQTVFESNGPEGKIRGNAQQIYEKYIALATDAAVSDDKVLSESFFQHAEHYLRLMLHDTDIDYDTYRREQQMRRDGLLNVPVTEDSFDYADDMMMSDEIGNNDNFGNTTDDRAAVASASSAPQIQQNREMRDERRRFAERRPPAIKAAENVNRMIDPPGFLSTSVKKEIKIEPAARTEQKSMVLDVEHA